MWSSKPSLLEPCMVLIIFTIICGGSSKAVQSDNESSDVNNHSNHTSCRYPATPRNGVLDKVYTSFPSGIKIKYKCNPGYILLGSNSRTCAEGIWLSSVPHCVMEVGSGRPSAQSSVSGTTRFSLMPASFANDDTPETCATTSKSDRNATWRVDLIQDHLVSMIGLLVGESYENVDLVVRVGNKDPLNNTDENAICRQMTSTSLVNSPLFIRCKTPIVGRYLSVSIRGDDMVQSLCEVKVYSESSLAANDVCPMELLDKPKDGVQDFIVDSFQNSCYVFYGSAQLLSHSDAESLCSSHSARLPTHINENIQSFLTWQLTQITAKTDNLDKYTIWLDGQKMIHEDNNKTSITYQWSDNSTINTDQLTIITTPESRKMGGANRCLSLTNDHIVRTSHCEEDKARVVCQFTTSRTCGKPATPENMDNVDNIDRIKFNESLSLYKCHNSAKTYGGDSTCMANGVYSDGANLRCEPLSCNMTMSNGTITYTHMPHAMITCATNFTLLKRDDVVHLQSAELSSLNLTTSLNITCLGDQWQDDYVCVPYIPKLPTSLFRSMIHKICNTSEEYSYILSDMEYLKECATVQMNRVLPSKITLPKVAAWITIVMAFLILMCFLKCLCCGRKQTSRRQKVAI